MTVARPLFEEALLRLMGGLTAQRCAELIGRAEGYLHDASNPNRPQQLTVRDAITLDVAHIAYDGTAPLFAAIGAILSQARAQIYVDAVAITDATIDVIREDSEAHLALVMASRPNATAADLHIAKRELEQSSAAQASTLATICSAIEHRHQMPP